MPFNSIICSFPLFIIIFFNFFWDDWLSWLVPDSFPLPFQIDDFLLFFLQVFVLLAKLILHKAKIV
jgi:hypothetical protein